MKSNLPTNGMAISSVVLGAITLMTSIIPYLNFLALLMGGLGVVFGIIGYRQVKQYSQQVKGSGLAVTGIVLNVLGVVLTAVILGIVFKFVSNQ